MSRICEAAFALAACLSAAPSAAAQTSAPPAYLTAVEAIYDASGPTARLRIRAEIEGRCLNTIADLAPIGADAANPSIFRFALETQDPDICLNAIGEWVTVLQIPMRAATPISEIVIVTGAVEQRFPVRRQG